MEYWKKRKRKKNNPKESRKGVIGEENQGEKTGEKRKLDLNPIILKITWTAKGLNEIH